MRVETPRTPKHAWFHCTTAAPFILTPNSSRDPHQSSPKTMNACITNGGGTLKISSLLLLERPTLDARGPCSQPLLPTTLPFHTFSSYPPSQQAHTSPRPPLCSHFASPRLTSFPSPFRPRGSPVLPTSPADGGRVVPHTYTGRNVF
ncbi:hypothetical protein E2C01_039435 [Portunus trituberculatus]|uniref:Uncharacterized protein n=1 Tax=Portunus trituberculatus TaxID=210409 RepID=A0A5B7FKR7_PORTR|nr:hypothetical protein [Portunus trituberculatus]